MQDNDVKETQTNDSNSLSQQNVVQPGPSPSETEVLDPVMQQPAAPSSNVKIVKTDADSKDGQNKCPACGSTEITLNPITGRLRCDFCRNEFDPIKVTGLENDISKLEGQVIGSGAQNISSDAKDVVTLKCTSCGAEVVIDTASASSAKCHWCRSVLSINQQIPNGSFPDVVLPFHITKDEARTAIEKFVGKRKFFANPNFKKEFTTENIMGVYFSYMIVDENCHAHFSGQGEHQTNKYVKGSGDNAKTYYDADLYAVERDFDLTINGLTVESNSDKLNNTQQDKTNNVINSIMPFDIENCVKYDSNYLKGYTSEKRDVNVDDLKGLVEIQSKDIARYSCLETIKNYDRGVSWNQENLNIKGQQWQAAYLPVWLYSYLEKKGDKKILHYVAVNARTKETMGSVPIHMPVLILISILVEILGIIAMLIIDFDYSWIFAFAGIIYFLIIFVKYRNSNARHTYEKETKTQMSNLTQADNFIEHRQKLTSSTMSGANHQYVGGQSSGSKILNALTKDNAVADIVESLTKDDNNKS